MDNLGVIKGFLDRNLLLELNGELICPKLGLNRSTGELNKSDENVEDELDEYDGDPERDPGERLLNRTPGRHGFVFR